MSDESTLDDFKTAEDSSPMPSGPNRRHAEVTRSSSGAFVDNDGDVYLEEGKFQQYSFFNDQYLPCGKTTKKLAPGVYHIGRTDEGKPVFQRTDVKSDEWLNFRDDIINDVTEEISNFWERGELFKSFGYLQRRGYMFYGPPGTGKTVLVKQLIDRMIKDGGVIFMCDTPPHIISPGLKAFTDIEPNRRVICIFEDIDSIIDKHGENSLLGLLDGEDSIDHVLNIATTNYPEKLDRRIVGRPRRFDRIIKITYPDKRTRDFYFRNKLKLDDGDNIDKWVNATESFTFAALTELVISVKCLGNDFDKALQRIRDLLEIKVSSDEYKKDAGGRGFGFGG